MNDEGTGVRPKMTNGAGGSRQSSKHQHPSSRETSSTKHRIPLRSFCVWTGGICIRPAAITSGRRYHRSNGTGRPAGRATWAIPATMNSSEFLQSPMKSANIRLIRANKKNYFNHGSRDGGTDQHGWGQNLEPEFWKKANENAKIKPN